MNNFNANVLFLGLVKLTLFILLMKNVLPLFWNNGKIVLAPGHRKHGFIQRQTFARDCLV